MLKTMREQASEASMQAVQLIPRKTQFVARPDGATKASPGYIRGGLQPRTARRIREYIDDNIELRVTVGALAKIATLSVSYFARSSSLPAPLRTTI